jgi:hypothetical protein
VTDSTKGMREWLVIEDSRKNGVFAPPESKNPRGFIPRDVAERILGRRMEGTQWFTREESELMREQPEWTDSMEELDNRIEGFGQ